MVPQRRRRRRVIQHIGGGAWRVIVTRGPQGFGFTISGQAPCVISHVASGGPADRAGLRAGLVLMAVGGATVARTPHDIVARLIAAAPQAIALTVTCEREGDPSDTSDDDHARSRPRYPQRPRLRPPRTEPRHTRLDPPARRRFADADCAERHGSSLLSAAIKNHYSSQLPNAHLNCCPVEQHQDPSARLGICSPNLMRLHQENPILRSESLLECKAVVGYLGTIETPTPISNGSELHTVRTSIRKLRQEKRSSTIVLLTILPSIMTLKKLNGNILAEYIRDRIIYISCGSENDYRYFGLITCTSHINSNDNIYPEGSNTNPEVEISHSCHVFIVDSKLADHNVHLSKANEFQFTCSLDPVTNYCLEFPATGEYIVGVIRSMYSLQIQNGVSSPAVENISKLAMNANSPAFEANFSRNNNRPLPLRGMRHGRRMNGCANDPVIDPPNPVNNFRQDVHDFVSNSPQPSNHSEITTTSSNSDSGIGFHNDCQNIADRILVVEFGQQNQQVNNNVLLQNPYDAQSCRNDIKQRPLGIVGSNFDMDSSFLSNTMPVVDGFGGRGQPLNHLDDVMLRVCDIQQPHCSFNNSIIGNNFPKSSQDSINADTSIVKDTYNYNNVHYGNLPSSSKDIFVEEKCENNNLEGLKNPSSHYDPVYTEPEANHYELIKPQTEMDPCFINNLSDKFKGIDIYQDNNKNMNFNESAEVVADASQKSSNETESVDNMTIISSKSHDYMHSGKTSMDNVSMYSSRSQEYISPSANRIKKLQASVDDILMLGLGNISRENNSIKDDENFVHPGNVKFKLRKRGKPLNILAKTRIMFHGKDDKKNVKSEKKTERVRALSASIGDVCAPQESGSELIPTASSEPDLRDNSSHNSESDQSSPFRRWTTGGGSGTSYRQHSSQNMYNKQVSEGSGVASKDNTSPGGRVTRWALGLEHLLADPAGAAAFAAFLSKEFAAENIKFWWSCEQYTRVSESERAAAARELWGRHLAERAPEPVNVDAPAVRAVALNLDHSPPDLFLQAQKQIFNLMKFDSYPRFLRSAVHAECARADLRGDPAPYSLPAAEPATPPKLKKSASNVSERRRSGGSMLPWSRRAGSRDRDLEEKPAPPSDLVVSGVNGACPLCRVVLPDGATSVVSVEQCITVRRLVDRLLSRRALLDSCRAYDVMLLSPDKPAVCVDLDTPSLVLGGKSARVERRCVFRLELPGRRAVAVRCRPGKRLRHVLRPVLARFMPDHGHMQPSLCMGGEYIPLDTRVQDVDGNRLQVVFNDECGSLPVVDRSVRGPAECEVEPEPDVEADDLRLQEESPRSSDADPQYSNTDGSRVVRAELRPGPPLHPHPHPPDFLENLRQTQKVWRQNKPLPAGLPPAPAPPRLVPPPLPPKPRPINKYALV